MRGTGDISLLSWAVLWIIWVMILVSKGGAISNSSVSTILVFGDSTVDPGNNNYIKTVTKSNFPPYGKDFPYHAPTGRFSNGRLMTDFIASYAGIKENVPPYLDPSLSIEDLMTGVSFASAATGYDPLTAKITNVIPVLKQLKYFGEYKTILQQALGKNPTETLIHNALFVISAGTNDFVLNYFGPTIRRLQYSIPSYQRFLLQCTEQFIQGLVAQGARKIAIFGIPTIGCLPAVITLKSKDILHGRHCVELISSVARDYNLMLQNNIKSMKYSGAKIYYVDFYSPLSEIIYRPTQFGFDNVDSGCCGTGLIEVAILCNKKSSVCPDTSKFVFFDSIHPSEKTYSIIVDSTLSTFDLILKE